MNYGRGSPIAQNNDIVQNGDSWFSLTPPGRLMLPRSAPVPVDMPRNQRIGTWQDLLGVYSEILNHDVAIQTPNPSTVTSITGRNFDLIGVGTEVNQQLDRNADAYVQNFSIDSAGSCNNRATEVNAIRTAGNYVLSNGQRNNGQISIRCTDSNTCTQVAGNWRELESASLMLDRQHSLRRTDSNSSTQVASNWTELESTSLMLDRQHSILYSNQRFDSLNTKVGSNTQVRSNWMQHEANMLFGKQKCTLGSNQRLSEASALQMHNNGYHAPYRTSYNLNSPPRPGIANAEVSVASSFPFAPVTPDQRKHLDHQTPSERLNVSIDECSSQGKEKQSHVVSSSSGENENTPNEFSRVIVDAASAAISTPLKEANVFNEIEEHGLDLNKTPDQKTPKKRKHRPKVVREVKPKKVPKSAPPKTEVPNGTPSGKRKYVRKKNIKSVENQKVGVVNEVGSSAAVSSPKSCRRALNFDLESSTGDASQNMRDGHRETRHQEDKRPFNLNADAETYIVIDSMSRTSSCQMEQSRQHKEFIEKKQQTTFSDFNGQMPSQLKSPTEQRNDYTFARNLNIRNVAPGQSSLTNGYIQVPEHTRREEIRQDVFQADLYRQSSTQLVMKDMANWNENRGFKRSHCHTVQEIHTHNQNMMIPPFSSLGNSCLKNKNGGSSNIGTSTSGTQKRLNTGNGLHVNISSMHSPATASIYSPGQVEADQVKMFAKSGSSELNCRLLNSGFERDKTSKKFDCSINGAPRTPITGKQNYQKQQATITLHAHRGQMTGHVYRYEASTSDSQQAIVGYSPPMSTGKQMLKPAPLKQGSGRAEKMLLQQHNYALECCKPTPKKTQGKLGKQKMSHLIEEITFRLEALLINIKRNEEIEQEQHALVPYKGSSTIVPYEQFDIKKRKPRPKVDLDPETDRIWKLLMGIDGSESAETTDKDKEKWWEGEREVFRGRTDSFIARMHLVQGDRRFSRWKGSVVDSVIGVFLTQNVSDHLSSSAFMSLVARFPFQSSDLGEEPDIQVLESSGSGLVEEPDIQVLESSGSIKCHEEIERQPVRNLPSYIPPNYFDNLPSYKANVASDYNRKSDAEINVSRNSYEPFTFQASRENIIPNTRSHSMAELQGTGYNSIVNCSPLQTVLQTEVTLQNGIYNHANSSSGISAQWHDQQSEDPILGRHNYVSGPAIFPHQTNAHILHGQILSSRDIQLNLTSKSTVNDSCKFGLPGDDTLSCFPTKHPVITRTDGSSLTERYTRDMAEGKTPALQNGVPNVQPNLSSFTFPGIPPPQVGSVQPEHSSHSKKHELKNSKNLHSELAIATKPGTPATKETNRINGQQRQNLPDNKFGSNANMESNSSVMPLNGTSTNVSPARKGKGEAGRKIKIDWDNLRKDAQLNGKRERSKDTMDSLDYEAMRRANVNEISDAIRERGMNNMLAERIKDFLDRLVNDHGSIDLEWLRDVPPDKAKDYLLSIRGLGLKSVECVRLLTLHQLAFPVDTNVGRIAVRLGWVPLQPLPESLQLHLLELYPILESIQKYLWPRLCKLDQQTLYELHYQMITFGKVFCTKSKPNCNACPMRGECRHFASAFASARLALPGPEEKSLVSSAVPITTDSDPLAAVKPVQLLEGVQDQNNDAGLLTKKYEPIVEEPSTPEQEIIELVESDIEDAFGEDPDEIPTIKLNLEEFTMNLQNYMQDNMELQEGDMSRALVALNPEAASIPTPKLKNVSRLRTEHQVYELPDSHPLLEGLDRREPDDPSPYLLAIWTPGETADSVQPPEKRCETHESGQLCNDDTCFSCSSTREANSQIVRGTLLIPCRTAMRGSFPLNGTYFQVNEMFADHESSLNPIDVPRSLIWNLPRRTVYFGTSVTSIFKGLPTEGIQYCFWRGFVCVRGFDHKQRAPRPLMARLHFPASKLAKAKK